ncbi:MAG TPA: alpha/beta hydrolase-fold protein [Blastocatellia bacterium]|nr:alpha/beta hydrolase-fold protein [Blastocatellia bacterium]
MKTRTTRKYLTEAALLCLALGILQPALGQAPRREPTPNDTLVSPEVQSDNRVTFRLYAPKASEVILRGDWMETAEPARLVKDDKGVWAATVGPLVPDFYSYSFSVDGVRTLDPKNALIKQGVTSVDSMVFVAGSESAFQENRQVPHGEVRKVWYQSTTLNTQRRMHIYTPPGYDSSRDRYPVFYLLHGGGDEDSGWSTIGRAGFIVDNLLAEKKIKPMIVIMPNGSLPRPANLPTVTPGVTPTPEVAAALAAAQGRFTNELLKDIVPFVEKNYRVLTARENRAIAGLSMGGGQTLQVVTSNPDQFAYVAVWSAGVNPQTSADFEKRASAFLENPEKTNKMLKLFSISVGDKDFTLAGSKNLSEMLKKRGIKNEIHISGGGHTWINWRHYLNDYAQLLFR